MTITSSIIGDEDPFFIYILVEQPVYQELFIRIGRHILVWPNQTVAERIVPSDVYMLTGRVSYTCFACNELYLSCFNSFDEF